MTLNVRHPIWLPAAPQPGAMAFAILFVIESFARALVASVVPIQAYDVLRNEQSVSFLYTAVGLLSITGSLFIPALVRRFTRRWVYTLGAVCLILASIAFVTHTLLGQATGMLVRVFGVACLNITLNLYIMDYIRRHEFVRSEPLRLATSTISWTVAPFLGVWLYTTQGLLAVHGLTALWALLLIAVFWYYRLSENKLIAPGRIAPTDPINNIRRFAEQPRLRLAWVIAFGRSAFWSTFFVYGPILMVSTGQGNLAGGALVSAGNAVLIFAIVFGRLGSRHGVRTVITVAFFALSLLCICAGMIGASSPWLTAGFLLLGTLACAALDALGGIAFLRSVHPHERAQMTAVYRTYTDASDLLPAFIYGILLGYFGLGSVFAVLGVFLLFCSWLTWRFLPRSM
ncbi:MFS family permease [Rhodoligotrophos appendicifer]|uniref:MFS transporter n=1 Tax=Rhodoligotrophos appendicifer TaxID=987056 RepID=UPI001184C9F4|nr:MFS transporter [Rhodoligotrophos appendicifer]